MRSEAVASLRNWVKDRLGDQEEQLLVVERGIARLGELDEQRAGVLNALDEALGWLTASGLDAAQVAAFVGADVTHLRTSRARTPATTARRDASLDAGTVGGS
jgi:hypothetical protein